MIEACDSDADIETLRKMIKMQAGEDIKLTRKQMCEAYDNIHASKLPLPPLVMTSDRTYLLDRASPLKHMDYELLFDSSTKRVDLKRIARKVGLTSQIEQMTKKQLVDAIGKRLRYLKVREPVKIVTKRLLVKKEERNVNNTAVNANANRYNNTAVNANANRYNNTAVNANANRYNNTAVNTNANRYNNTAVNANTNRYNNTAVNANANRYNNTAVNTNANRYNNTAVNTNANRYNNTAVNRNANRYNNTAVNTNANRYNNTAVNTNANRYNNTAVNRNSGTV